MQVYITLSFGKETWAFIRAPWFIRIYTISKQDTVEAVFASLHLYLLNSGHKLNATKNKTTFVPTSINDGNIIKAPDKRGY